MPDWDEDSPQLRQNLARLLEEIVHVADRRDVPTVESARQWQSRTMEALDVPDARYVGRFRGEPGLEHVQVRVGPLDGVPAADVKEALARFEQKLQTAVAELDGRLPSGGEPNADELDDIIDLCAWVHAEWVRIRPFANGNGRTARLWANSLGIRYGLPPFVRLRPRPDSGYGDAGASAMRGEWKPTAAIFHALLDRIAED